MLKFAENYINELINILKKIDMNSIEQIVEELKNCAKRKGKVYVVGNGGSAATSSHLVNDLGVGLTRKNILGLDIISLSDNVPVITAIANDTGYENIFYLQIKELINPNDIIIAISCSGNSDNIIKAVKYAKENRCKIIGMTGFDGGELKKYSDINFHVETEEGNYGQVEDVHLILDHIIYSYFIKEKSHYEK